MSSKNYWTKIREIAIDLNKIGRENFDETFTYTVKVPGADTIA